MGRALPPMPDAPRKLEAMIGKEESGKEKEKDGEQPESL
jgi:hypothetical protein